MLGGRFAPFCLMRVCDVHDFPAVYGSTSVVCGPLVDSNRVCRGGTVQYAAGQEQRENTEETGANHIYGIWLGLTQNRAYE